MAAICANNLSTSGITPVVLPRTIAGSQGNLTFIPVADMAVLHDDSIDIMMWFLWQNMLNPNLPTVPIKH